MVLDTPSAEDVTCAAAVGAAVPGGYGYPSLAGPVGYGARVVGGRGTIVAVDLTILMVLY